MSSEQADDLNLKVIPEEGPKRQFALANGTVMEAIGHVTTSCAFASGTASGNRLLCIFYVFKKLAVSVIMGLLFLRKTETLSRHRNRLVELEIPLQQSLRINLIGCPK